MTPLGVVVRDRMMAEHSGDPRAALADLSDRFAAIALQLERADRLRSFAFAREVAPAAGAVDDVPASLDDKWVRTEPCG